jgi:ubiquinone/menaquinone biosynthesis C-methylase UbiE
MPIEQERGAWRIVFIPAEAHLRLPLRVLAEPHTGEELIWREAPAYEGVSAYMHTRDGARRYPVDDGIVSFLEGDRPSGPDWWSRLGYDVVSSFYDRLLVRYETHHGRPGMLRQSLLDGLVVDPGQTVLEVSVGTGLNLWYLPPEAEYVGLDLSMGMLRRCQANLRYWRREALLVQANASAMPFRDGIFDVVFHLGGLNWFTHPQQALREMIRVARPGALIVVEDVLPEATAWSRLLQRLVGRHEPPIAWVPPGVDDLRVSFTGGDRFYRLSFRKPR